MPRRSPRLELSLLLAVAPLVAGCDGPEARRCVGPDGVHDDIPAGKAAPALFLAARSTVGLVNAACMEG